MAYPSDLPTVTVRHRIVGTDGTPARGGGKVTATLTGRLWTGEGSIVPTQATFPVAEDGTVEMHLVPVDHPAIVAGKGEAYLIREPGATIDTRRPGRVATQEYHVAPVTEMVGQTVDVSDVLVTKPKPGGGVERITITGPATDESLAGIIADPNSQTAASLSHTIATEVSEQLPDVAAPVVDDYLTRTTILASHEINRIVAVEVGQQPSPQDGDLIVRYDRPGHHYFTDFTATPAGQAPADWTQPWNPFPGAAPTVQAVPDAVGGKALVWQHATTNGNRAATVWEPVSLDPDRGDVEMLVKLRATTDGGLILPNLLARVTGNNDTATATRAGYVNPTALSITRYNAGTWNSSATVAIPASEAGVWYLMRYRVEGTTHRYKIWKETDAEPDWQIDATDTIITTPGKVGLLYHGLRARTEVDWVAVATGRRVAAP